MLSSVFWRYVAIAAQFLVVLLIAQRVPLDTAGKYFGLFGFVAVAFTASGLGAPDGLVKHLPRHVRAGRLGAIKGLVRETLVGSLEINVGLAVAGILLSSEVFGLSFEMALAVGAWWFGYAIVFLLAQVQTGLIRPAAGAFIAYSAISLSYLVTQVPYLLFADTVTLDGMLVFALLGTCLAVVASAVIVTFTVRKTLREHPAEPEVVGDVAVEPFRQVLRDGTPMMLSRLMQASLPWIPTWILLAAHNPESAAIYAAASRLTVAVTSVVAALRFSVRPQIVLMNEDEQFDEIGRLSRRCSRIAAIPPLLGLIVLAAAGGELVTLALGNDYETAAAVLAVLMFGVLAEAFGGMSDEILKMTGHTRVVIESLVLAVAVQIVGCVLLVSHGPVAMAASTALAFAVQYITQVIWLARRSPIHIWRFIPSPATPSAP